jgi:hypothetical protein
VSVDLVVPVGLLAELALYSRISGGGRGSVRVMSEIALADLLEHLEGIGAEDIRALARVGVYSVDELDGCCRTGTAIAELSRRTGIADDRLRRWLGRPLLFAVAPAAGAPDARVVLHGANLGAAPDDGRLVLFQGRPAAIEEWSPARIVVRMPGLAGRGMLFAVVGGEATNAVEWQANAPELAAGELVVEPARALAGEPVRLHVTLENRGTAPTGPFELAWEVGDAPVLVLPHGSLEPGQISQESSVVHEAVLPAGAHVVRFSAAAARAEIEVRVAQPRELRIGVSDPFQPLEPSAPGPVGACGLVFDGPFEVAERVPAERLVLRARADRRPLPRLDRIVFRALAPEDILAGLEAGDLDVGRLPFDAELERALIADGRWRVVRVPSGELDVQSRAVCERTPAAPDPSWNAHLWYVRD